MIYPFLRRIAFLRDAESVHESALHTISNLQRNPPGRFLLRCIGGKAKAHPVSCMGLTFKHPVGIAAGFDKDARGIIALQELGFAYVEIGTITPKPQPGNPKPRIWRFPEAHALVNALGFPGEGMVKVGERLALLKRKKLRNIPIGINIGKNKDTSAEDAPRDYRMVLEFLYELGDYFVVNVSSPNTAGLRDLQTVDSLRKILEPLIDSMEALGPKPLLVKIAPDLADEDVLQVVGLVRELKLAGIVAANTTIRRSVVSRASSLDRGGLSGPPLYPRLRELLKLIRPALAPEQTLIAVGGIDTAEQVRECLQLGANLVQVYTSFIYLGPRCARRLTAGL
jgi:dihydroorotate dehydrogenase